MLVETPGAGGAAAGITVESPHPTRYAVPRRELVAASLLTAAGVALLYTYGPAPGDAPAHLYRTYLVQHGILLWDNLWYGGQYPLASYSLLYYLPAAVVGNLPLVIAASIASAFLFTSIALREWGRVAYWPSRVFGVLAAAPLFTGLYSYTVGFATLLGALRALQSGRFWLMGLLAIVTLGLSPLAFVFLCLLLLAIGLSKRRIDRNTMVVGIVLASISALEVGVLLLFPSTGNYPFHLINLVGMLIVCSLGVAIARRAARAQTLAVFFAVWGIGSVIAYVVPSPVGGNWSRLNAFVFPLMLLTAALARFQPRSLIALGLVSALAYNLIPYALLIPLRTDNRPASVAFWKPTLAFLHRNEPADFRVEVVPTAAHWEAYWLPRAGYALARGWYEQLDTAANPVLYKPTLKPAAYRAWLRRMGVKYVVLPATVLDPDGGSEEARLLTSGAAGLKAVYRAPTATIYELAHPTPLLTGPGAAEITTDGHESIRGTVAAAGDYLLRFRYTPYWTIRPATSCILQRKDGMTELEIRRAGSFEMQISQQPEQVLESALGDTHC